MIRRISSCLAVLAMLCVMRAEGQPLAAYTNIQNQLMVWDNGLLRKVDYLPPTELRIGRNNIPYLDNARSFKIYYAGGVRTINAGFTNSFRTSDDLTIFLNAKSLNVFDRGTVKNLSLLSSEYYLGDSLVVFNDAVRNEYKAYYNGAIYPIESYLAGEAVQGIKVSDNVAAYNNYARQFHIFWHGNILTQEEYSATSFDVGRNICAYVDAGNIFKIWHSGKTIAAESFRLQPILQVIMWWLMYPTMVISRYSTPIVSITSVFSGRIINICAYVDAGNIFKIWHSGKTIAAESFPPSTYTAGDNVVAYVSNDGYFKIFYADSVYNLGFFRPDYQVGDNVVAFRDAGGYFKVFYKGEITQMESYYPESYIVQYNSLVYRNRANVLRMFSGGEVYDVTTADAESIDLNYDVLRYRIGDNFYRVYYGGQEF